MTAACGRCGTALRAGARFCAGCGAPAGPAAPGPTAAAPPVAAPMSAPTTLAAQASSMANALIGGFRPPTNGFASPDPNGLGLAFQRLSPRAQRQGKIASRVAAVLLEAEEQVECVLQGRYHGSMALLVVTGTRALLTNDAEWRPVYEEVPIGPGLTVQGWQDERAASLVLYLGDRAVTLDMIVDRQLAQEVASRIRARAAAASPPPSAGEPDQPSSS